MKNQHKQNSKIHFKNQKDNSIDQKGDILKLNKINNSKDVLNNNNQESHNKLKSIVKDVDIFKGHSESSQKEDFKLYLAPSVDDQEFEDIILEDKRSFQEVFCDALNDKQLLVNTFSEIQKRYEQKQPVTGIPTGFPDLDYKTAGLHNSDLILIAARPAMGKSAFALNIATNVAVHSKVPVAVFNLEMSKNQLVSRILCSEAMVDSNKVRTGKMEEEDWVKIATALRATFRSTNIYR